jgi:hypothetical protein
MPLRFRFIPVLLFLLLILQRPVPLSGQNHFGTVVYQAPLVGLLSPLSFDTLAKFNKQLSGVLPVTIGGTPVTIPHRYAGNGSTQFQNAAQFIYNTFAQYGLSPVLENNASPYTKINVVGTLPGRVQEYVIICGHFDSANQTCPGSDDNASGTCAVLEAARLLRAYSYEYTIKFIAFGGEEQGLLGSAQYATVHASDSIRAVVNADMIIWDGNANGTVQVHARVNAAPAYSNDLADYISDVNTEYGIGLICDKHIPGLTGSDHSSFWNIGKSAVCLIEEYGVDFCPYYHTANDAWSNYAQLQHQRFFLKMAKLAVTSTALLAQPVAPTPVELASFTAEARQRNVLLQWRTASETNNRGFAVERAPADTRRYEAVGFVEGNGTTHDPRAYSYTDAPPADGAYLYRLRQIDFDGSTWLSPSIAVEAVSVRALALAQNYPNPFNRVTTITYDLPRDTPARLTLCDMLGREVRPLVQAEQPAGRYTVTLSAQGLAAGLYFCRLECADGVRTIRMMVQ